MTDSILADVKKMIGVPIDYDAFDLDILLNINAAFSTLSQLGALSDGGYTIDGYGATWSDLGMSDVVTNFTKTYLFLSVKRTFDPPTSSFVLESINKQISELEWRIVTQLEQVEAYMEKEEIDEEVSDDV